jgi:hypothetical protein
MCMALFQEIERGRKGGLFFKKDIKKLAIK